MSKPETPQIIDIMGALKAGLAARPNAPKAEAPPASKRVPCLPGYHSTTNDPSFSPLEPSWCNVCGQRYWPEKTKPTPPALHSFGQNAPCGCPYQPMARHKNEANTDHGPNCADKLTPPAPVSEPPINWDEIERWALGTHKRIDCGDWLIARAYLALKAQNAAQAQELERLRDLIAAISCDAATIQDCERYCAHGLGPLHAEARAIRAIRAARGAGKA